jgi:primosomal protein N' (replication factor Y) (superfamily II helicase)
MFCRVVLRESTRTFDREYTYAVPSALASLISAGCRVLVPFGQGNRSEEAYVTAVMADAETDFYIKPVIEILSERPVLLSDQIRLAAQMRSRYLCTYGDAIKCMVPAAVAAVKDKKVRMAELLDPPEAAQRLADGEITRLNQVRVIELLLECGSAPVQEILGACQISRSALQTMEKKQLIRVYEQEIRRTLEDEQNFTFADPFPPTPDQAAAIGRISEALGACQQESESCLEFLLFGVTGSGKTEVYLQCARKTTDLGRGVMILVPEISLTPQMISRIRSRFGTRVAVLHSRLTPAERYEQWQRIIRQEVQVVVGARSAVFAPLQDIGLIIVDEEQETTYKSETHPRYHARDIARLRARAHSSVLLLGSATPSIESYHRTQNGQAILLTLHDRIGAAVLAETEIVDMRREFGSGNRSIFSQRLRQSLNEAFAAGHQAIILINRRGYAGFLLCRQCGYVAKCRSCSVSLTSHLNPRHLAGGKAGPEPAGNPAVGKSPIAPGSDWLICHYCGRISHPPKLCPNCGSSRIGRFGAGTQQVEAQFNLEFSPFKALRMDQDTTVGRTAHARLLDAFSSGEADALIGTQMIAKGHDFPNVTVVGILSADLMLGISDFRASERAFQLITQAAGRAGRGASPGRVIIQAYNVDDFAVRLAAAQDYPNFYQQEIVFRRTLHYPPFGSIGSITLSSLQETQARDKCRQLTSALRARQESEPAFQPIQLMEPSRAPITRIKDRYRWRLVMKGPDAATLANFLMPVTDRFDFGKTAVAIDIDPYQMM